MGEAGHDGFRQVPHEDQAQGLRSAWLWQQVILHRLEQPQEFRVARAINRRRPQNDILGAAVVSHLQFAGQLALAVFGNRLGRVLLARGLLPQGRSRGGQAGNMHQPLHPARLRVDRGDDIARPGLVNLVKPGNPASLGRPGAMDDVRDARHRLPKAFRVADRAGAHFDVGQMGCDKPLVAGGPEQEGGGQTPPAEAIENVAADKPARSCEQDLQSDQAEFLAHLAQLVQGEINLLVRVRRHQADADQFLSGRHRGGDDGVDEQALLLQPLAHLEGHHQIPAIHRQNGRFRVARG